MDLELMNGLDRELVEEEAYIKVAAISPRWVIPTGTKALLAMTVMVGPLIAGL